MQRGTCHFEESCDAVKQYTMVDNTFQFGDNEQGSVFTIRVPFEKLLIPGNELGDTRFTCYIGVFRSTEIDQDTWYIGN